MIADAVVYFVEFDEAGSGEGRVDGVLDVLQVLEVFLQVAY